MIRLLLVTGFWPTEVNTISGIFVVQQVNALARAGAKLTVLVLSSYGRREPILGLAQLGLENSMVELIEVPILRLPEAASSLPGAIRLNTMLCGISLNRYIRRSEFFDEFSGCIVHSVRYAGLSMPMWRGHISGGMAIVIHGVDPFMAKSGNQQRVHSLIERASLTTDAIVLVGSPLVSHAMSLRFPAQKLQVLANGTDLPSINTVSDIQRPLDQVRRILSVSNLLPLKGVDDNLRALASIANTCPSLKWEYRVVGDGPYRGELEKLAADLGIRAKVEFLGRVAYDKTMQEIAESDVFSLPSWGEAFGIVYLEAMARMRPVIGCFDNGAADIFSDDVEGRLVPPKDVPALAAALTQLICDPALCSAMGQSGRATAETKSWDANAKRMLGVLGIETTQEDVARCN